MRPYRTDASAKSSAIGARYAIVSRSVPSVSESTFATFTDAARCCFAELSATASAAMSTSAPGSDARERRVAAPRS